MKKYISVLQYKSLVLPSILGLCLMLLLLNGGRTEAAPTPKHVEVAAGTDTGGITKAPEAVFEDGGGKKVKISALKGKVVFINFWATWCPPCRAEMPTINKLYAQLKDNKDIVFLIVDADNKFAKSNQFLSDHQYDLPLYVPGGNIPYTYFSGALPTTVMINKKGEIVFRHAGAADYNDPKMVAFIKKLIAEKA